MTRLILAGIITCLSFSAYSQGAKTTTTTPTAQPATTTTPVQKDVKKEALNIEEKEKQVEMNTPGSLQVNQPQPTIRTINTNIDGSNVNTTAEPVIPQNMEGAEKKRMQPVVLPSTTTPAPK